MARSADRISAMVGGRRELSSGIAVAVLMNFSKKRFTHRRCANLSIASAVANIFRL